MKGIRAYTREHLPKYLTVGGTCSLLNAAITACLAFFMPLPYASASAFGLAGIVAFIGNYHWTYSKTDKRPLWVCFSFFVFAVVVLGWGLNRSVATMSLDFFVNLDGFANGFFASGPVSKIGAYLVAAATTLPFSATWNHRWTFRPVTQPDDTQE